MYYKHWQAYYKRIDKYLSTLKWNDLYMHFIVQISCIRICSFFRWDVRLQTQHILLCVNFDDISLMIHFSEAKRYQLEITIYYENLQTILLPSVILYERKIVITAHRASNIQCIVGRNLQAKIQNFNMIALNKTCSHTCTCIQYN